MPSMMDYFKGYGESLEDMGSGADNFGMGSIEPKYKDYEQALTMMGYPQKMWNAYTAFTDKNRAAVGAGSRELPFPIGPASIMPTNLIRQALAKLGARGVGLNDGRGMTEPMIAQLLAKHPYKRIYPSAEEALNFMGRARGGGKLPLHTPEFMAGPVREAMDVPSPYETARYLQLLRGLLPKFYQ